MRKSDKKLDNRLRAALTEVCETALKSKNGFQWLTHLVQFSDFPNSLKVVCVFDTNENLNTYMQSRRKEYLQSLIESKLKSIDIKLKNIVNHVSFDTEENCEKQHGGNWSKRLG